jgi:hypothetical protein
MTATTRFGSAPPAMMATRNGDDTIDANCDCVGVPPTWTAKAWRMVQHCPAPPAMMATPTPSTMSGTTTATAWHPPGLQWRAQWSRCGGRPLRRWRPNTGNDVYDANCACVGELIDCLGVPGGSDLPGSACDDGDPSTTNDLWDQRLQTVLAPHSVRCGQYHGGAHRTGAVH